MAAGIDSIMVNQNATDLMWHMNVAMGGIDLQVKESDLIEAQRILDLTAPIESQDDDEKVDGIVCPNCGSANVRFGPSTKSTLPFWGVILSILVVFPFPWVKKRYHCFNCDSEFRAYRKSG